MLGNPADNNLPNCVKKYDTKINILTKELSKQNVFIFLFVCFILELHCNITEATQKNHQYPKTWDKCWNFSVLIFLGSVGTPDPPSITSGCCGAAENQVLAPTPRPPDHPGSRRNE